MDVIVYSLLCHVPLFNRCSYFHQLVLVFSSVFLFLPTLGAAKVPLVSYDIIQKLLRNPRATFDEAQQPMNPTNEDSMGEEERNQYNR